MGFLVHYESPVLLFQCAEKTTPLPPSVFGHEGNVPHLFNYVKE